MEIALTVLAGWLLLAAAILSWAYELWRATARTGVGPNDAMRDWLMMLPVYAGAVAMSALLIAGWEFAPLLGFVYAVASCLASTFWYGPRVLLDRRPGLVDWIEDRLFTMLVAVVAVLLGLDLAGISLVA